MSALVFITNNIVPISIGIVIVSLVLLLTLKNTLKLAGKVFLTCLICAFALIALGVTTIDDIQMYLNNFVEDIQSGKFENYADYVNQNSTAEQFIK